MRRVTARQLLPQVLFIADSEVILLDRALGMKSIGVSWGSFQRSVMVPHFDHIVDSIDDLLALLSQQLIKKLEIL